jgi:hypothetical protein
MTGEISACYGIITRNFCCALVGYGLLDSSANWNSDKTVQK